MASFSYTLPFSGEKMHRALLFGGETTLANPAEGISGHSCVPPTLGDTWLYDFAANTWNRVRLLGQGVHSNWGSSFSRTDIIQSYKITFPGMTFDALIALDSTNAKFSTSRPSIRYFTPPPLSGAMMVTRTYPRALSSSNGDIEPLKIPEVFLLGGRTQDGKTVGLDTVWKFCTASPGERPSTDTAASDTYDTAECDAYDETTNPDSTTPTAEYTGRWLKKDPSAPSALYHGSYLGAGTYDSRNDRILVYGGLSGSGASATAITDSSNLTSSTSVFEYTPPSKTYANAATPEAEGSWTEVIACTRADGTYPAERYAHALAYDTLNSQLILTGGLRALTNSDGTAGDELTSTITLGTGNTITIPEVWTATKLTAAPESGSENESLLNSASTQTYPCYLWKPKTIFGNSPYVLDKAPISGSVSFAASTFIPSSGYNTGFYTFSDQACQNQGPVDSGDGQVNKLLAGGAYLDLDRGQLLEGENLLLHVTFLALGTENRSPAGGAFTNDESAQLKVHLMSTGMSLGALQDVLQPRHLQFANPEVYPRVVDTLAILAPPASGLRQEQIVIPISTHSNIDRIRIERYSGSAILIDATLFRTQSGSGGST
jgi:hypothetical protein